MNRQKIIKPRSLTNKILKKENFMKEIISLFALICLSCSFANAQCPDWSWAKRAGGSNNDAARFVTVDKLGNAYLVGNFASNIMFGTISLTNVNTGYADIFLAKYNPNGDVIWAKSAGGYWDDIATSVALDTLGNIYVAGYFQSPFITFDTTVFTNANSGDKEIFLTKFNANGSVVWAKTADGGEYNDETNSVSVDATGNIYVTGDFTSPFIVFGSDTLVNAENTLGSQDIFLTKYDSNGNILWTKNSGGTDNDAGYSIAVDSSDDIYLSGSFKSNTISFDTITLTNAVQEDIFIVKYKSDGNVLWASSAGNSAIDVSTGIATDVSGNAYLAGYFQSSTIIFDSITLTNVVSSNSTNDVFLVKYDPTGNVLWAKSAGGAGNDMANSISVDTSGNSYITGIHFNDIMDFDSITSLPYVGRFDIFLAKYDTYGNVLWVKNVGAINDETGYSIGVGVTGDTYLAGSFKSASLSFDLTTLTNVISSNTTTDIFLAKLDTTSITTGYSELNNLFNISIFPNPSSDKIKIISPDKTFFEISNINGQIIKTINHDSGETSVDIRDLSSGVYIVRAKTDKEIVIKKIIKE
jgi:hypothetical protein